MWIDSKDYLTDNELSLGAKGAYAVFRELKKDDVNVEFLIKNCNNGHSSCKAFVKELIEKGYLQKEFMRTPDGRMAGTKYYLPEKVLKFSKGEKIGTVGFIYLFKKEGQYKIGITKNVKNRSSSIKGSSTDFSIICYEKIEDYMNREQELHRYFADKNIKGEWFNLDSADIEYIKSKFDEWKVEYIKPKKRIKYCI